MLWKSANACPLPKVRPIKNIKKDLRPVSLTLQTAKMLEHYPVQHLRQACPVVDPSQFGAVRKSSTTLALIAILHPVYVATDDPKIYARLLLIDYSKAFDHINHQIVLRKLTNNGVHPIIVNWYHNFLEGRRQRVKVDKVYSGWSGVNGGVPQGTLSGPELFIHMLSDFKTVAKDVKFVDDTTLITISDKVSKSDNMQQAANQTSSWSKENDLGVNETKTKEMLVFFGNDPDIPLLEINGQEIERVTQTKLLGVIISSNLKWDAHVQYIHSKAGKRLYYLRELKRSGLSQTDLIRVYLSLVRSICEYACQVWSTGLSKETSNYLETVQRRAFRIVLPKEHYADACEQLQIPTLKERRDRLCKSLFESMCNPDHRLNYLLPEKRSVRTRSSLLYELPKCRTERYKNSFIPWCLFNCQEGVVKYGK